VSGLCTLSCCHSGINECSVGSDWPGAAGYRWEGVHTMSRIFETERPTVRCSGCNSLQHFVLKMFSISILIERSRTVRTIAKCKNACKTNGLSRESPFDPQLQTLLPPHNASGDGRCLTSWCDVGRLTSWCDAGRLTSSGGEVCLMSSAGAECLMSSGGAEFPMSSDAAEFPMSSDGAEFPMSSDAAEFPMSSDGAECHWR
jgi:hypothetical protein